MKRFRTKSIRMKLMKITVVIVLFTGIFSCSRNNPQGEWIVGSKEEQVIITEKHFRGLDVAMLEIGHRYQELYWAGQDENWEYASYQLDKIKLTLANAIERRPLREESGDYFLKNDLPGMADAVSKMDSAVFNNAFRVFTISCNSCHAKEKVSYFNVQVPVIRTSIIKH